MPAAVPEMTGDLLNAALRQASAFFIKFQCLVKQEVFLHPSDTT